MRIERELMRGAGPVAVMKLLQRGEMYGYEVVAALARMPDGVLDMGQSTVYPMLYNLEAKGLVESVWRASESGRDRKYYRLTSKGQKRLADDMRRWESLAHAMTLLGVITAPGSARMAEVTA